MQQIEDLIGYIARSLVDDPDAPFGHRLDPTAVLGEFDEVWSASDRQVTLVEASDLSRAAAYRPRATPEQARRLRTEALTDADALLGQLLERIDPAHDAVLVVSPVSAKRSPALGVAALAAGIQVKNPQLAIPQLVEQEFSLWFAGVAFAAIAVDAFVPAAIMSIAAANL